MFDNLFFFFILKKIFAKFFLGNWDPYSYNHNVHWNSESRSVEANGIYDSTVVGDEIDLPGIKVKRDKNLIN